MAPRPALKRPRRALLSVTDKAGLTELARALADAGWELIASGGTRAHLAASGLEVAGVSELTEFPEIFGGRVKTLHPRIFGGILGAAEDDFAATAELGVRPLDLVVVNLYDFAGAVAADAGESEVVEHVDIGGPSLLRAAAKNFDRVCVLPDPCFYDEFLAALVAGEGFPDREFRRRMATAAFDATAAYDAAIADWFTGGETEEDGCGCGHHHDHVRILGVELRYGENPHQHAELLLPGDDPEAPLAAMGLNQLGGKELSYNNLVDVIAAVKLVDDLEGVRCAALKHTNPCGVGVGATPVDALARALLCDPESAFGGIFAFSDEVDAAAADILRRRFCEVVLAPAFTDEALATLQRKKNVRELTVDFDVFRRATHGQARAFGDVELHQDEDEGFPELETWRHAAGPDPDEATLGALRLNWRVCKHVKSNAIVLGDATGTLGIGAGQMSRVDSAKIAVRKAGEQGLDLRGCVCASDAFFPFADSLEQLHAAGVKAAVAPGGSIRDDEVAGAADRLGMTLMRTDRRHFRH